MEERPELRTRAPNGKGAASSSPRRSWTHCPLAVYRGALYPYPAGEFSTGIDPQASARGLKAQ